MIRLSIKNFSCIRQAELELAPLTVLVGPQASGKSVISKLSFFFLDILSMQFAAIEDKKGIGAFKFDVIEEFIRYFPPSAWGRGKFRIEFVAGPYSVAICRTQGKTSHPSQSVELTFSRFFEREYGSALSAAKQGLKKIAARRTRDFDTSRELELFARLRRAAERRLAKALGPDFVESQLFIPAGRSFFTSIGKAFAALDRGAIADPLTVRFGKYFALLRERGLRRYQMPLFEKDPRTTTRLMQKFFGGKLRTARGEEFIEADDGRKIPFGMLSSGQQELLPLLLALDNFRFRNRSRVYIEEPEAHLFPSAQSDLVDVLVGALDERAKRSLFITTHSPYVLTRLNILAKAGQLAKKRPRTRPIIWRKLRSFRWISPSALAAYAIKDNKVVSILTKDGLIDGDYLDEISNDMNRSFNDLLELEFKK